MWWEYPRHAYRHAYQLLCIYCCSQALMIDIFKTNESINHPFMKEISVSVLYSITWEPMKNFAPQGKNSKIRKGKYQIINYWGKSLWLALPHHKRNTVNWHLIYLKNKSILSGGLLRLDVYSDLGSYWGKENRQLKTNHISMEETGQ